MVTERPRSWTEDRGWRGRFRSNTQGLLPRDILGNERKEVFRNGKDRKRFLSYLESATTRYGARVHVYCLSYRCVGELGRKLMSKV